MPNWKNRSMMMKSGGSVNKETLIDIAKRLQEERVNFGPLYSNKKSRGARFDVRDGILDLIQDKESGKKSLKYTITPTSQFCKAHEKWSVNYKKKPVCIPIPQTNNVVTI